MDTGTRLYVDYGHVRLAAQRGNAAGLPENPETGI